MPFPLIWEEDIKYFHIEDATGELWESSQINPVNVIRTNERWGVMLKWKTTGGLNDVLAGNWIIKCLVEEMGASEAPDLPSFQLPVEPAPYDYSYKCEFAAGLLKPGVYKLVVAITVVGEKNLPGPFALLGDGPLFQVYDFPG